MNAKDFIYSVYINKVNPSATAFELKYEINDSTYWLLKVDIDQKLVSIGNQDNDIIKSQEYSFISNREYKLDVIVNDGLIKLFIDNSGIASLVYNIQEHVPGNIIDNLSTSLLDYSNRDFINLNTLAGDFFCSGYDVIKVINLTDDNYKLDATSEYTINEGILDINDEYLNTLENNTECKFRAVTSLTDLDFYIKTKEVGAQAYPLVEKYYRGDDAKFELSEATEVSRVFIDQQEFPFEQDNVLVTVKNQDLQTIKSGSHTIKFYTKNGRPETNFSLYPATETVPELPVPVSHTFLFIDIAIFSVLIIGYVVFTIIKKKGEEKV